MSLAEVDPTFEDDFRWSDRAVIVVAQWLRHRHHRYVLLPPFRLRPNIEDRSSYADEGDLFVSDSKEGPWARVEVKHRPKLDLENGFEYPTVMVDPKHRFDSMNPKPVAYVFVDKRYRRSATLVVTPEAIRSLTVRDDHSHGRKRRIYHAPSSLLVIRDL